MIGKLALSRVGMMVFLVWSDIGRTQSVQTDQEPVASNRISNSLLLDITQTTTGRMIAVGDRGHILWSDDQGEYWHQAQVSVSGMLTAVTFPSSRVGYAVGHDAVILKTVNGGLSWKEVYKDIAQNLPLLDVWFANTEFGIAAGAYGMLLKTGNGGKTWQSISDQVRNPDGMHYNAIHQDKKKNIYLVGEGGIMLKSSDQASSWQNLTSPYQGSWFGIHSTPEGGVQAYGLRGNLYQSKDQGQHWQAINTSNQKTLFGSVVDSKGRIYLVGDTGALVSGYQQQWQTTDLTGRQTLSAIISSRRGDLIAVGEQGVHTINPQMIAR